jgi:hypothetical protein
MASSPSPTAVTGSAGFTRLGNPSVAGHAEHQICCASVKQPIICQEMPDSLPPGDPRLLRPESVVRYTYEDFEVASTGRVHRTWRANSTTIVSIEAASLGDTQVVAAHGPQNLTGRVIDLGVLQDVPSVDSVVVSTRVVATRELPNIRELLFTSGTPAPDPATLRQFRGLVALHAGFGAGGHRFDLDSLPVEQIRKLAVNRWSVKSLTPLERMRGLRRLTADVFRDPLDAISQMHDLEYLRLRGPAKGWAKLRDCTRLEEAHLIEVQIANLRRWNTWSQLRNLTLSGRGVKSLAGLEFCQGLEELTLLNLKMSDLAPLRQMPRLTSLQLRMADAVDLESVASLGQLRSFIIDSSQRDNEPVRLQSLRPLARATALEEIALLETVIEDGDLLPLADLSHLKKVRLASRIGADVDKLRAARPDLQIDYTPPDTRFDAFREQVGFVTIQRPGEGLEQWSIFQDLASRLGVSTNYAAESRVKREVRKRNPELARHLDWDTEAGAVGCYANEEADIRAVADIVNEIGVE